MFTQVQVINDSDWDNLVEETYGRPYCFQQQGGCKERGIVNVNIPEIRSDVFDFDNEIITEKVNGDEMGVSFKAWLSRDPGQKLDTTDAWDREHGLRLWWERNFYPTVESVAFDLYQKGLIPCKEFAIEIDW